MKINEKVTANHQVLVGAGKSSRLAAIRKKAGLANNIADVEKKQNQQQFVAGLNQQTKDALQQARIMIDDKMDCVINGYPAGKKKTYFKLKYGIDAVKIKGMTMKEVFVLLKLDAAKIQQFRLIENLDHNGNPVGPYQG